MTADAACIDDYALQPTTAAFALYASRPSAHADVSPYAMTSSVPVWLWAAKAELEEFSKLEPGWNSYGAEPVSAMARTAAYGLLRQLATARTPRPALVPTSDGSVQIEWHTGEIDLEIRVLSPTRISICFEDSRGAVAPIEDQLEYDLTKLEAAMQVLSNNR